MLQPKFSSIRLTAITILSVFALNSLGLAQDGGDYMSASNDDYMGATAMPMDTYQENADYAAASTDTAQAMYSDSYTAPPAPSTTTPHLRPTPSPSPAPISAVAASPTPTPSSTVPVVTITGSGTTAITEAGAVTVPVSGGGTIPGVLATPSPTATPGSGAGSSAITGARPMPTIIPMTMPAAGSDIDPGLDRDLLWGAGGFLIFDSDGSIHDFNDYNVIDTPTRIDDDGNECQERRWQLKLTNTEEYLINIGDKKSVRKPTFLVSQTHDNLGRVTSISIVKSFGSWSKRIPYVPYESQFVYSPEAENTGSLVASYSATYDNNNVLPTSEETFRKLIFPISFTRTIKVDAIGAKIDHVEGGVQMVREKKIYINENGNHHLDYHFLEYFNKDNVLIFKESSSYLLDGTMSHYHMKYPVGIDLDNDGSPDLRLEVRKTIQFNSMTGLKFYLKTRATSHAFKTLAYGFPELRWGNENVIDKWVDSNDQEVDLYGVPIFDQWGNPRWW